MTLARGVLHLEKIKRLPKSTILALGVGFIVVAAALAGAARESYRTSQREAQIFASLSADAFRQGFCDRASGPQTLLTGIVAVLLAVFLGGRSRPPRREFE